MEIQERVKSYEEAMLNDLERWFRIIQFRASRSRTRRLARGRRPVWIKRWKLQRVMVLRSRMSIIMPAMLKSARVNR